MPQPTFIAAQKIALALGSNLGDRDAALHAAVEGLSLFINIQKLSPVYETPAAYVTDQPPFMNAAIIGETKLSPLSLLWSVKQLETELGREPTFHYGPRRIDIDILFYGDQVMETPELTIPHTRIAEREFVLRPLADIAPNWLHPKTGLSVEKMLDSLSSQTAKKIGALTR